MASSSLGSIFVSIVIVVFALFYPQKIGQPDQSRLVGVWRRLGSFFIDLILVLLVAAPWAALPILVAEGHYTGNYQWSFEREFARASDTIYILPAVFAIFFGWFYYIYGHLRKGRLPVGQYILSYKVTNDPQAEHPLNYAKRVLFSFLGLCAWPVSLVLAMRSPTKQFWWDSASNTKVEKIGA